MNYVLTGGAGHITKPLAKQLLEAGHQVTVIGRSIANLQELIDAGAVAAVGTVEDTDFLKRSFSGADAVYTMVPPKWDASDWKAWIASIGNNYAEAIKAAGVKYVVNLSSIGADLDKGVGPVTGLHRVEEALNAVTGVHIKHLRPAYFYENLLANIPLIKQAGIMGGNYSFSEPEFALVDQQDIAAVAAEELLKLDFTGTSVRYIVGDEVSTDAIAATVGIAIGKPDLAWVKFTSEQSLQGMIQAGLSEEVAANYVEMGEALDSGRMAAHYKKNRPKPGKITFKDFAKKFAAAYENM